MKTRWKERRSETCINLIWQGKLDFIFMTTLRHPNNIYYFIGEYNICTYFFRFILIHSNNYLEFNFRTCFRNPFSWIIRITDNVFHLTGIICIFRLKSFILWFILFNFIYDYYRLEWLSLFRMVYRRWETRFMVSPFPRPSHRE